MHPRTAILLASLFIGVPVVTTSAVSAQEPGRGRNQPREAPPPRVEPRELRPEARPRQDPPRREEPARPPQAQRTPPPRSTGEPELRRRKP
jgi:stringent starvation protein B